MASSDLDFNISSKLEISLVNMKVDKISLLYAKKQIIYE